MKKMIIVLLGAAAALAVVSCEKKNIEAPAAGTPIEFELGAPDIEGLEGTKMTNKDSELNFKWEPGDALQIFSYDWANSILTNWGLFTTEKGGAWARFSGLIPAGYTAATHGGKFTVVFQQGKSFSLDRTGTTDRYDLKFNIPAEQDGTGIKYCLFGTATTTWPSFDPDTKSFTGMMLRCYTSLSVINVTGPDIRTIKITVDHAKNHNFALASTGDKLDLTYNCSNNGLSGGTGKTITINDNDKVLSGNIFFASRQTNGNATNGYTILTFEFINGAGKTATKVLNLATGINSDGTAAAYKNLSTYNRLNRLPAVSLAASDFE